MPKSVVELQAIAKQVRRDIIEMIGAAGSGHPGGSLSAVELLVQLYFDFMRIDPKNPKWPDRDRFIQSKGHACPVMYSVMAEIGLAPKDKLNTLRKMGSIYQGHPDVRFLPTLEASTGSLGEGLSLGLGMGLADRLDGRPNRTYVMLGDGESQEGQIWEAAMSGSFHKLDNVVAIVDYNGIQLDGFVKDIMEIAPLADKWRAFGWHAIEIDGHDFPAIRHALEEAQATKGRPTCIVAHTVKGKGVSFMENQPKFHGTAPTPDEMKLALQELQ
jgi:transketolase